MTAPPNSAPAVVVDDGTVSDEQLKKAEAFIEEEDGAVNRFRGWLGDITTALLVVMSLFHLWAGVDIVPAQVLRPVRVGFRAAARVPAVPDRRALPKSPDGVGRCLRGGGRCDDRPSARGRPRFLGPRHHARQR